ncbi:hypothetical protein J8J14_13715 [Roseomonas sp. SSH11]|uniref:Uncharacterized protein n=1 Tax=Pararoseomonas baculiformis TaxID=2820812 RepID=A0ABS4AFL8_9PROT|nr:hypothetical protein [Pararoseomonas baculiformis]MBP0445832.1 hypothetical protein [Pararoseomonas baculiformis]
MDDAPRETCIPVPGWDGPGLRIARDMAGRLLRISAGNRLHAERRDGELMLGEGLVSLRELAAPGRLIRAVHSQGRSWQESYHWNKAGQPILVDGVSVARDGQGRVVACDGPGGCWRYGYDTAGHLAVIDPPDSGRREIGQDEGGPACTPLLDPFRYGRDALGRLWTLRDGDGRILQTYLWDGLACLGRIDGPPDAPAAEIFSLDLTLTPVRATGWDRSRIIPRDAFGEALLDCPGVPGLFGGVVAEGLVHLRARSLDPRRGRFTAPDPFDGSERDPRRAGGWRGTLPTERDGAGHPFAVCRNDPIGRADPTGEMSAGVASGLLLLSSLTWSSGNMLASFFLLEPLNFLLGLFSKEFWTEGRWFSKSAIRSRYHGGWGFRFDPVGFERVGINKGRAWTFQHAVWAQRAEFTKLAAARAFIPSAAFRPALYGSLLRIEAPADGGQPARVLLLHGPQRPGGALLHPGGATTAGSRPEIAPLLAARGWTRRGGPAEPVIPGARVPVFPSGGLHFEPQPSILAPRSRASITEIEPGGEVATGLVGQRHRLAVKGRGLGLPAGQEIMLTGPGGQRALLAIDAVQETGGETRLVLKTDPSFAPGTTGLRLRGVTAPTPPRAAVALPPGSALGRLDARTTSASPFTAGTPLRLSQAGAVVSGAVVDRLEAAIELDLAPDPPKGDAPRRIWLAAPATAGGDRAVTAETPRRLAFPPGTAPTKGTAIQVFIPGADAAARLVTDLPDATHGTLDRDLPPPLATAAAGALRWRPLERLRVLGPWNGATSAAEFVYRPETSGIAVAAGPVLVVDGDDTIRQVRDGKGLRRDELVLGTAPLPGNPASPYDVEPLAFSGPERGDVRLEEVRAFTFSAPPGAGFTSTPRPALSLQRLSGPGGAAPSLAAASATPLLQALPALSGPVITLTLPADLARLTTGSLEATRAPGPGQAVRLTAGAAVAPALVKSVRIEVETDRDPGLGAAALSLVPLMPAGFLYAAELLAPDRARLRPEAHRLAALEPLTLAPAPPPTVPVQMPQFAAGEMVRAVWNGVAATALLRVEAAEGTTLRLAGPGLPALVAAAPADLKVMRMAPVNPFTGATSSGIRGTVVATTPAPRLRFDAWSPDAIAARPEWYDDLGDTTAAGALRTTPAMHHWWAVTDGNTAIPVQITRAAALTIELHALPPTIAGTAGAALHALHIDGMNLLDEYGLDGSQITAEELNLPPGPGLVLALPYKPAAGGARSDGRLSSGTVMIPDDATESWYLDRPTSLETHELRHTLQSAMLGPLLFGMLPVALIEDILKSLTGLGDPEWSAYAAGRIATQGGLRRLEIPNPGEVEFAAGRKVELSTGGQVIIVTLGEAGEGGFLLTDSAVAQLPDGIVQVRQGAEELNTAEDVAGFVLDFASFFTLGNLASTLGAVVFKLVPDLIRGIVHALQGKPFFDPARLDFVPATVPDPARPAAVQPGGAITLHPTDRVRVQAGERSLDTVVTRVDPAGIVELATAPPTDPPDRALAIALIARDDPLAGLSTGVADYLHVRLLHWIYDPWAELHFATKPDPGSYRDELLALSRWAFSSSAWSMLLPGVFIWDNLFRQVKEKGHLSSMEQGASAHSGDLYSSLARLGGSPEWVGDIARYRFWTIFREGTLVPLRLGDAPGAGADPKGFEPWIFPRRQGGAPIAAPNRDQQAAPDAASDVPDILVQRNLMEPALLTVPVPNRVLPAPIATLPCEAGLQRTAGIQIAFTRPGDHRITTGSFFDASDAQEAQDEGSQTIFFDRTVKDVSVRAAGHDIPEGGTIKAVPCQRVTVSVAPAGDRRHALMLQRPVDGAVARLAAELVLQVQTATGQEVLEVQRVHVVHPFGIQEDRNTRWPQFHLLPELRIPVRRVILEVVDRIPVHASLLPASPDPLPPPKPFVLPGEEGYLIIPARLHITRPALAVTYPSPRPANGTDPDPALQPVTPVPSALAQVVGEGAILRIPFDPTDPPEETCLLEWTLALRATQPKQGGGTENISANIRASIEYRPHFRLELPAAGDSAAAGGSLVLHISAAVKAGAVTVTPSDGIAVTVSADGRDITLAIAAGAAKGPRKVLVEDAAVPAHQARRTILVT